MRHVLSRHLQALRLDEATYALAHGLLLQRMVVSANVLAAVMLLAEQALTADEFVDAIELDVATPRETLLALWRSLVEKGLVVPEDGDEDAAIRRHIAERLVGDRPFTQYQMPHRVDLASFEIAPAHAADLRHL